MIRLVTLACFVLASFILPPADAAPAVPGNTLPTQYKWDVLTEGKPVYVDRGFVYTKVPAAYSGTPALRTANNDKNATSCTFRRWRTLVPVMADTIGA